MRKRFRKLICFFYNKSVAHPIRHQGYNNERTDNDYALARTERENPQND